MKAILSCMLLVRCFFTEAQTMPFLTEGVIEYEKSINLFPLIQKHITKANELLMTQRIDAYRKTQPQFRVLKSNLSFSGGKTLFVPVDAAKIPVSVQIQNAFVTFISGDDPQLEQLNIIYTDIPAKASTMQKTVYEQTFLVKDIARPIKWKFTEETREIAGYTCRRANGLMMDSIYVVAFYTEDIPVSGGPESFNGLPGMILGVSLPDEHVTWFATKVEGKAVSPFKAPEKGKAVNNKELKSALETALKSFGAEMQNLLKAFLL